MTNLQDYKTTLRGIHDALDDLVVIHRETEHLGATPDSYYDLGQLELIRLYRRVQWERLSKCLGEVTAMLKAAGGYDDVCND